MKKNVLNFRTLAALLVVGAAFTACSNDQDFKIEKKNAPTDQAYTLTVQATKESDAITRGLNLDGKTLNVKWNEGEKVDVVQAGELLGTLEAKASDTGSTTLSGTVSGVTADNDMTLYLHGYNRDYTGQNGLLVSDDNSIENKYDYAECTVEKSNINISGSNMTVTGTANFKSSQAIVKFIFPEEVTSLTIGGTIKDEKNIVQTSDKISGEESCGAVTIVPSSATNTIYAAIMPSAGETFDEFTLSVVNNDGISYFYTRWEVTFSAGKYYVITVKNMTKGLNLGLVTSDVTAKDGYILTGTLEGKDQPYKISIADGAKVSLVDATINGAPSDWSSEPQQVYEWAGLTCEGDATIELIGTNFVKGFDSRYPGLTVAVGSTLTINGDGSLEVMSNGDAAGIGSAKNKEGDCGNIVIEGDPSITAIGGDYAAGIGSCFRSSNNDVTGNNMCGDITIKSGTVLAIGGKQAAGIGASFGSGSSHLSVCGNITISGGTVTAEGGELAAAIGGGYTYYTVGNITISDCIISATKGEGSVSEGGFTYAPHTIGHGANYRTQYEPNPNSTIGTVTVGGVVGEITESPYIYEP